LDTDRKNGDIGDGVEPPTPVFSGATETALTVTYKDVEGCETPVRTRKDIRITG
jgi:hypothetical protein